MSAPRAGQSASIRPLADADAEAFVALRREALVAAPLAFLAAPGDDFITSADQLRERLAHTPAWMIFGAFDGAQLVGAVGIYREPRRKLAHKAQIWGMYVVPRWRRRGAGAELLRAALAHARTLPGVRYVHLSVSSAAPEARRIYERAGFVVWGTEPEGLREGEVFADEHHLLLRLPA